jgi:HprK-related kinase A
MSAASRVRDLSCSELDAVFARDGLYVDYGACVARVRARVPGFSAVFRQLYRSFEYRPGGEFADLHVQLARGAGLRRWLRAQSRFSIDGVEPFEPFPQASVLPLFEWGLNWCFAKRCNQYVLLHAGTLALGDRAVLMAALPGSGKSTLSAAMMLRGFRLLSDEFGVLDPETGTLLPMLKPVALKNRSIGLIRDLSAAACVGPTFVGTRKGDVAHLAPDEASAAAVRRAARPELVIFPAYREGAGLDLRAQVPEQAFARLAFNSFNYAQLGAVAFNAVADIAAHCPAYQLTYSRLDDAIDCIRELLASGASAQGRP